jgi:hypothetical protein
MGGAKAIPINCYWVDGFRIGLNPSYVLKTQHRLERSIRNQHDARQSASRQRQAAEEIPMYQRALPVRQPLIARGERLCALDQLKARTLFRALVDHSMRLLRLLGEFFAAGGALS